MSHVKAGCQKAYNAEHQVQWFYDTVPNGMVVIHGIPLQLEPEARYGDLGAIQAYVDRATALIDSHKVFSRTGGLRVRERKTGHAAHYQAGVIAVHTRGSGWAMRETVILHEIAHHYAAEGGHGKGFQDTFTTILGLVMGAQVALAMRMCYQAEGA